MATLINGNGNASVYAQQDADLYAGFKGNSTQILNVGSKLAATIEDSNTIAVADGVILTKEGRRIQVDVGNIDEFIIPTGQAGTTRYYIFGYHLYTDGSANQKCETFVQLMSDGSETITENTFRGGATEVYVSLYRVKQEGLTLGTPAALLSVCETIDEIKSDIDGITASLTEQAYDSFLADLTLPYTATKNCLMCLSFKPSSAGTLIFTVNGNEVYNYSNDGQSWEALLVPLKKGDIFTSSTSFSGIKYSLFKLPQ